MRNNLNSFYSIKMHVYRARDASAGAKTSDACFRLDTTYRKSFSTKTFTFIASTFRAGGFVIVAVDFSLYEFFSVGTFIVSW